MRLVPIPPGERPFEEIAMDFLGELLESEGFDPILVLTYRLTKVQQYLPAKTTCPVADFANADINELWRLHELPRHITSDRGQQVTSKFYTELNRQLNINLRLSTAYHPHTDRLSARAVQTRKQYLRIDCHDRQNRWEAGYLLPNLPTTQHLPPRMDTLPTEACMPSTLTQYTSITTTNSPPPPLKNG